MLPFFIVLVCILIACPFVAEWVRRPMTPESQDNAKGQMAELSNGRTHFRWSGPEDGPVAVCIPGLSTPSYIFAGVERTLSSLGYRVLSYDLFGRGYSDRPHGNQSLDFFLWQLRELLDNQKVSGPLTIIGYSMGGAIATAFAAEEGSRIRALVLLAPAGLSKVYPKLSDRIWTWPLVGDWLMRVFGGAALRRELALQIDASTIVPDLLDRQAAETRIRGYLPALLSSRRHALKEDISEDHETLHALGTPVLAIWGTDDPVIPQSSLARLTELNPDTHHVEVKWGGHAFPQTHPGDVAKALEPFLRKTV